MVAVSALQVRVTQSDQKPDLNRFLSTLRELSQALGDVDRASTPGRVARPRWIVEDLDHQGLHFDVRVTAGPTRQRDQESLLRPVGALVSGVRDLRAEPELPAFYSENTVERLLRIAKRREGIEQVSLATVNGKVGHFEALDEVVLEHARSAVVGAERSIGSISGTLTALKKTRTGLWIALHDPVARRTVNGTATFHSSEELRASWDHRVIARGEITRNMAGQALRIRVTNVERLTDEPVVRGRTRQLYGADPGWLDGVPVDEYMREARARA